MTVIKFHKTPNAVLDYSLDWSSFLTGGDFITDSTWSANSSDISLGTDSYTNTVTTIWVSSGILNETYELLNQISTNLGRVDERIISIYIYEEPSSLSSLITQLRYHLGDVDPQTYRYTDDWLLTALESAIRALQRWWGEKYLFDASGESVFRNPDFEGVFTQGEPPIIQQKDERPIILMASILVKSGQLENNSWQVGSWRDAEIAVSNIEGNRSKEFGISQDWAELQMYLKPPQKQLFGAERNDPPLDTSWTN